MQKKELELYLHIPFCVRKCHYCDFLSAPSNEETREQYVQALCREIASYKDRAAEYEVSTVFFGGGTPTLLRTEQFEQIISALQETFTVSRRTAHRTEEKSCGICNSKMHYLETKDFEKQEQKEVTEAIEFTVECNPGTLTEELLSGLKRMGVNRLSIGLQSADDEELKLLGRIHNYEAFLESFRLARAAGFGNINVDLMQALPEQTVQSFCNTLQKVIALQPEHISAYSLMIEENTKFYEWYGEDSDKLPSEDTEREIYKMTQQVLGEAGYLQYEISNYAKPGYECRHNCGYWTGTEYLGLGLGASSYINGTRFTQTENLREYLSRYSAGAIGGPERLNVHVLSKSEQMEEFMFLGLRLCAGASRREFAKRFGTDYETVYGAVTERLTGQGLLKENGEYLCLTELGRDLSNRVLAEFLLD